jgi:hypothetical protein
VSMPDEAPRYSEQRYGLATSMNAGYQAGRGSESPGLEEQNQQFNNLAQQNLGRPQSVLQQLSPSPVAANLSAPSQQGRLLRNGFQLPNYANGSAQPTAETDTYLRMGAPE